MTVVPDLERIRGVKAAPWAEYYTSGHRTCQGCDSAIGIRYIAKAIGPRSIVTGSTGCMYVANTSYYCTPWVVPWMHTQLGSSGSAALGNAAGIKAQMKKGKIKEEAINIVSICGDGGGADMGLSAISATLTWPEYNCLIIMYDNESYANYNHVFFEEFMTDDADMVVVGMGTMSLSVRAAVRKLRKEGKKVGFVRLKWIRPWATEEIRNCLSRFKAVGVISRDYSYGSPDWGGILMHEVRSTLYTAKQQPLVANFICGLGGREIYEENIREMVKILEDSIKAGKVKPDTTWVGIRSRGGV